MHAPAGGAAGGARRLPAPGHGDDYQPSRLCAQALQPQLARRGDERKDLSSRHETITASMSLKTTGLRQIASPKARENQFRAGANIECHMPPSTVVTPKSSWRPCNQVRSCDPDGPLRREFIYDPPSQETKPEECLALDLPHSIPPARWDLSSRHEPHRVRAERLEWARLSIGRWRRIVSDQRGVLSRAQNGYSVAATNHLHEADVPTG